MATASQEIPVLPEGFNVHVEPVEVRTKAPTDVAIGFTKGMWAVVVEGVIVTRTSSQETATEFAQRVKSGAVILPKKLPKEWGRYAARAQEEDQS